MKKYKFLEEAWHSFAKRSPDSTKTTAILFNPSNPDYIILATCNDFPVGARYNIQAKPERLKRPEKYNWINHAERTLIAWCAREGIKTFANGIYMHWFPCAECAKSIIDAGIVKLVCEKPDLNNEIAEFWYFKEALEMLTEAGIEIEYL